LIFIHAQQRAPQTISFQMSINYFAGDSFLYNDRYESLNCNW
jgi:hypothetical protein